MNEIESEILNLNIERSEKRRLYGILFPQTDPSDIAVANKKRAKNKTEANSKRDEKFSHKKCGACLVSFFRLHLIPSFQSV